MRVVGAGKRGKGERRQGLPCEFFVVSALELGTMRTMISYCYNIFIKTSILFGFLLNIRLLPSRMHV